LEQFFGSLEALNLRNQENYVNSNGVTNILDLFDRLKSISAVPGLPTKGGVAGGRVGILPPSPKSTHNQSINWYVGAAIAEIVHTAKNRGQYSDAALDEAGLIALEDFDQVGRLSYEGEINRRNEEKKKGRYSVGSIGHNFVNQYCQYSEAEVNQKPPLQ